MAEGSVAKATEAGVEIFRKEVISKMNYKVKIIGEYEVSAVDPDSAKHYIESQLPSPSENKPIKSMSIIIKVKKGSDR